MIKPIFYSHQLIEQDDIDAVLKVNEAYEKNGKPSLGRSDTIPHQQ